MRKSFFLGWDSREILAYAVSRRSLCQHISRGVLVDDIMLDDLRRRRLYTRPMSQRAGPNGHNVMWDDISNAPQSTEHANARFLIRQLAGEGWAMFADCDTLFRADVGALMDSLDPALPAYCVHHVHEPIDTEKMDGQWQTRYQRKNWSSVFVLNCEHPANAALTVDLVNTLPGRDLHRFCWLDGHEIGALDPAWNYLVGVNPRMADPKIVHFTLGTPDMEGYESCDFADEWRVAAGELVESRQAAGG